MSDNRDGKMLVDTTHYTHELLDDLTTFFDQRLILDALSYK